jgi:hypothetical protein
LTVSSHVHPPPPSSLLFPKTNRINIVRGVLDLFPLPLLCGGDGRSCCRCSGHSILGFFLDRPGWARQGLKTDLDKKPVPPVSLKNQKNWSENLILKIWERNLQSFTGPFS